jgi:ribosomal protein S18 acetylase RimI-like enzyme
VLTSSDADEAGHLLARAFHTNPTMVWGLPNESRRSAQLDWIMTLVVRLGLKYGKAFGLGAPLQAVTVWYLPEKAHNSLLEMLSVGFARGPWALGFRDFVRVMRALDFLDRIHRSAAPFPHYYLHAIGVDPARQRQGLGSRIMRATLVAVDAEGQPCHLETDKTEDVAFYEKHGYSVRSEFRLLGDGPPCWTMSRPAMVPGTGR